MKAVNRLLSWLNDKKWFVLGMFFSLLAVLGIFIYLGMAQKPIDRIDITPTNSEGMWKYSLADRTEIVPDENGVFAIPDGGTLFCTISLAAYADKMTSSAMLGLTSHTCDAAVFADGKLIADPSHRFNETEGTFAVETTPGGSGIFSLGAARELTLAIRFLAPEASLRAMPSVTLYPEQYAYTGIYLTDGAKAALPAGVYLTVFLSLILLFLFQLYENKCNTDVLLLSFVSLAFCLLETIPFGIYVVKLLQTPYVTYFLRLLPTLSLLWVLWYQCGSKIRRFGWGYPLVWTLAVAAGMIWRQIDIVKGNDFTNLLQGKLLPAVMLTALIVCAVQAIRGSHSCRCLFAIGGVMTGFTAAAAIISALCHGDFWAAICAAFQNTELLGYFEPLQMLNHFLLLVLFFAAFYDFVMQIVRRNAELKTLTLQNRYAAEHTEHLRRSLDETHALRHEMRHHMEALKAILQAGDMARAADYITSVSGGYCTEPTRYTDHALINALISSCAEKAGELGAQFDASIHVPEQIAIADIDLAVLFSNMIDNALEAIAAIPDQKDRRLNIKAAIFENAGLFISCINTFAGERRQDENGSFPSSKQEEGHGLGLNAMRRVAEKYNNILIAEAEKNTFHIKTYLYFKI